jgi:hypothetical protein
MDNDSLRLTAGSALATNGTTGTTAAQGSGAVTIHNAAQTIGDGTTINNALAGRQYQNKVNGNLFVDGNAYINGTLDFTSSDSATTSVVGGESILENATQTTNGSVNVAMKGTESPHMTVDWKGRIVATTGAVAESTASVTLTNGVNGVHGLIVTERKTTISGGIRSSSLTLDDDHATFSNSINGHAIRVRGVDDGISAFDAVNVRQLGDGVAMTSALAALPQVDENRTFNVAGGVGHYLDRPALAMGLGWRPIDSVVVRVGGSVATSGRTAIGNLGVGYSW